MFSRSRVILLILLTVAALARFGFATFVVQWSSPIRGDETDYHQLASNLSEGRGFQVDAGPTGRRPPAYPAVLSVVYRVFGPDRNVARVLQVIFGVLVVYLTFAVTRRYFDEGAGLVAAGIAAINPYLIMMSCYLVTENLYIILLLLLLRFFPSPAHFVGPFKGVVLAAVLLGLAALARPTGLPLAVWILLTGVLLGAGGLFRRSALGLAGAVVFVLVVLPWSVRNYQLAGGWVGITSHGGYTFYQGNNQKVIDIPHYRGGVAPLDGLPHAARIRQMSELERERFCWKEGKRFLRDNATQVPKLMWWKFARFWRLKSDAGMSGVKSGWWWNKDSFLGKLATVFDVGFVYAIVVFPLFLAGIVLTMYRWKELLFLYGVVVVHTAVALIFHGSIRGRIPVEPVIALFAGVAVTRLYRRFAPGPRPAQPPPESPAARSGP
jgi:4-amino-4-deoxy-L-arabinose transferase-like glycosyltransferase